jgi:Ca2+-binding RTX toxin-like protein
VPFHVTPAQRCARVLLLVLAALAAAVAAPAAAQAADTCRASAARATAPGQATSEPVVANPPATPCASSKREAAGVEPVGSATVAAPRATTRLGDGVIAAAASVEGAQFGDVPISVGAVDSTQVASCQGGRTVSSGSSSVDALVINGTPVPVVADQPFDQTVGTMRVRANQLDGATRTGLILDFPDGRQFVLGEATATGDACAARSDDSDGDGEGDGGSGGPGSGDDGTGRICPKGAQYDVETNYCVIREDGDGGSDGRQETIIVGHPYEGQRGGSVLSLDEARQLAKGGTIPNSPCLKGAGPDFVVLGGKGRDTITGANTADRIMSLGGNDRVSGGVGADCIDGGRGADRLTGDNGNDVIHGGKGNDKLGGSADDDKLYAGSGRDQLQGADGRDKLVGGTGNDAVNGGSGTDKLAGGKGNDTINTGFGKDKVDSGPGRDAINAATAGPASKRIRCGKGRDTLRINENERRRYQGCETVHAIR